MNLKLKENMIRTGVCVGLSREAVYEFDCNTEDGGIILQVLKVYKLESADWDSGVLFAAMKGWENQRTTISSITTSSISTHQQVMLCETWERKVLELLRYYPAVAFFDWIIRAMPVVPKELEPAVKIECAHHDRIDVEESVKFEPTFVIEPSGSFVGYDPSPRTNNKLKHGQKKLFFSFLAFLTTLPLKQIDVICMYGAAPGYAVIRIMKMLRKRLVCIDDFPMKYEKDCEYYTFAQFDAIGDTLGIQAIFFDHYFPASTLESQYTHAINILEKLGDVFYSIKRFCSYSSSISKIKDSVLVYMIYTGLDSPEFREQGKSLSYHLIRVSGVENAIRYYNQKIRLARKNNDILSCPCYDCNIASYYLKAIMLLDSSLTLDEWSDALIGVHERVDADHDSACEAIFAKNDSLYSNSEELAHRGVYVLKADMGTEDFVPYELLLYDKLDLDLMMGMPLDDNGFKTSSKALDDENTGGVGTIYRSHRPPMVVIATNSSTLEKRQYALPLVGISGKKGFESHYTPQPGHRTYSWTEVFNEPSCVWCGFKDNPQYVNLREYLASYHPVGSSCDSCKADTSYDYYTLALQQDVKTTVPRPKKKKKRNARE